MEYIACVLILAFLVFVFRVFSFRAKSINCSINALKKTIDTLPDESTPSGSVMKAKLANKYYELSHRVQSNDIRDYAKKNAINPSASTKAYCDASVEQSKP
ncbi:hypothetical protein HJ018_24870 [Vibrio parahaemolyticus]|nr:hypothetical protein [Vibrio parahaemolyticus]